MNQPSEAHRASLLPETRGDPELARAVGRVRRRFVTGRTAPHDPLGTLRELLAEEAPLLAADQLETIASRLVGDLVGLGHLEAILDDPDVTDVLVNGPGPVWIERSGRLECTSLVLDHQQINRSIERLVRPLGRRADRTHPIVDARLADGTRVAVVVDPLAVDGPVLALRRHRRAVVGFEELAGPFADALRERLRTRRNIVVHGATGSGKTTLLNALGSLVSPDERIVTIEDVAELRLPGRHVVRLEARPGTSDGVGRVAIRELVRAALRLRPDRLVVGEVRGAEALDMVWALSTGHDGGMSTVHASSPVAAMRRLATLALSAGEPLPLAAVDAQVRSAVHVLVGVGRLDGGRRGVVSIHDVDDAAACDAPLDRVLRPVTVEPRSLR
ncbi:MAG: CpaF family protein [Actinobacteria bacterium]|nr:CpaF family protein [Actinomycetota bacterium]